MHVRSDGGVELNAEFAVESDGRQLSVVLESAGGRTPDGGRSRNAQYVPALTLLLKRLRDRQAVLLAALVASARVAALPERERTLVEGPLDLVDVQDLDRLRLDITTAQGRVGLPEGAVKEGNNRKRIRLRLAVPGYDADDASRLAADLASPGTPVAPDPAGREGEFGRRDLLAAVGNLTLHRQGGPPSVHKPLALLWVIGRVASGGERLVSWPEFRREFGAVLEEFGPEHSKATPQYPFWHLGSSEGLWEVHGLVDVPTTADTSAVAGLTRPAADLIRDDGIRAEVVDLLLGRYLTDIDHHALLERAGLGKASAALPGARELLQTLVGVEIHTATGKPNTVLDLRGDTVLVRTTTSPVGQPVGVGEVQKGLDLLAEHGSVRVSVQTLGHRSSFVGAVLATLPDARFTLDPAMVSLHSPSASHAADDPRFGGLDGMSQVRVRREQAQLRRLLAGDRETAPCALCGHEYPMTFLVAAHIKKRAVCTDDERRDLPNVAMLACTFGCDTLYESGWITVDQNGRVLTTALDTAPHGNFREQLHRLHGRRCPAHTPTSEPYFNWHRTTIFTKVPPTT